VPWPNDLRRPDKLFPLPPASAVDRHARQVDEITTLGAKQHKKVNLVDIGEHAAKRAANNPRGAAPQASGG
jgi:hypothetical protein